MFLSDLRIQSGTTHRAAIAHQDPQDPQGSVSPTCCRVIVSGGPGMQPRLLAIIIYGPGAFQRARKINIFECHKNVFPRAYIKPYNARNKIVS